MAMNTEQRMIYWNELHQEYENTRDEHAEDVDLNWTRDTHNYVMDRRLYYCYCRICNLTSMRTLLIRTRTVPMFIRLYATRPTRPFGFNRRHFNKMVKKLTRNAFTFLVI